MLIIWLLNFLFSTLLLFSLSYLSLQDYAIYPTWYFSIKNILEGGVVTTTANPQLEDQVSSLYPLEQGGLAVPLGTVYPITTHMSYGGTILYPSHHTGKETMVWSIY